MHALVAAQGPVQLVGSDIDCVHAGGTELQQAVGESSGRSTDV